MNIRTATVEDHNEILAIAKKSKYTKDFSNSVMFSSKAAYEKGWIRVYTNDWGAIIGFTCVREKVRQPEVVLYFIGIDPLVKRGHIGSALIADIMQRTKHRRLALNVSKVNEEARAFYDRLGFIVIGESLGGTGLALKKEW